MKHRILSGAISVLVIASCAWIPSRGTAADEEVDIVVNKSNSANALTVREARRIFMGEKSAWPGGKQIRVLMLAPGNAERAVVLREIYQMSEADYIKYFLQEAFTGKVEAPPKEFDSAAEMKKFLAANPGAIGYLRKDDVDASVKVVLRLR